jgi:hypothetical protein
LLAIADQAKPVVTVVVRVAEGETDAKETTSNIIGGADADRHATPA